jgi:thiamine-phosphate pyrophosphorylase
MRTPSERLAEAKLYLVCGAQSDRFLYATLTGGVDIVQLRMKGCSEAAVLTQAARFRRACDEHDALFILNDRPDLVRPARADGVHLGQRDVPVAQARKLVGAEKIIGLSTHSQEQVDTASEVDYIGVGPVYSTPTKPGRPPVGVKLVSYAARHSHAPFFAIGGINVTNVNEVGAAGARRIAVVRALTEAEDPLWAARELRQALVGIEDTVGAAQS